MAYLRTGSAPEMIRTALSGVRRSVFSGRWSVIIVRFGAVSSNLPGHPGVRPGIQGIERLAAIAAWAAGDFKGLGFETAAIPAETHFARRYDRSGGTTATTDISPGQDTAIPVHWR